jgi:hypothetical protein
MARSAFFSFHYQNDVWRANQIRNLHVVAGCAAAGFQDGSLWEESKKKGDAVIKKLIDNGLVGTSVTVVLVGSDTSKRKYVAYEIQQSLERGNGLLGIYVHNMKDREGRTSAKGAVPAALSAASAPVYEWDSTKFGAWVETAAKKAGK